MPISDSCFTAFALQLPFNPPYIIPSYKSNKTTLCTLTNNVNNLYYTSCKKLARKARIFVLKTWHFFGQKYPLFLDPKMTPKIPPFFDP